MPVVNRQLKLAALSTLLPIGGCYVYAETLLAASNHFYLLFPIPVFLLVTALGLRFAWKNPTRERVRKLISGNTKIGATLVVGAMFIGIYQHFHHI